MTYPSFSAGDVLTATDMNGVGLWRVVPTGATNGTVNSDGTVTVGNAVASVTVSGCFSSTYDNYRIIYSGGTGTSGGWLYFQVNGAPTGWYGNYIYANFASGAPLSVGVNNGASANYIAGCINGAWNMNLEVNSPNLTKSTFVSAPFSDANSAGHASYSLATSVAYTGFILTPVGSTMTGGTIVVYGYN